MATGTNRRLYDQGLRDIFEQIIRQQKSHAFAVSANVKISTGATQVSASAGIGNVQVDNTLVAVATDPTVSLATDVIAVLTAGTYQKQLVVVNSSGVVACVAGAVASSEAACVYPEVPDSMAVIGGVFIKNTTGTFTLKTSTLTSKASFDNFNWPSDGVSLLTAAGTD